MLTRVIKFFGLDNKQRNGDNEHFSGEGKCTQEESEGMKEQGSARSGGESQDTGLVHRYTQLARTRSATGSSKTGWLPSSKGGSSEVR
jgi:hypothetical protein